MVGAAPALKTAIQQPAQSPLLSITTAPIVAAGSWVHSQLQHMAREEGRLGRIFTIIHNASSGIVIPINTLFVDGYKLNTLYSELNIEALASKKAYSFALVGAAVAYTAINALKDIHPTIKDIAEKLEAYKKAHPSLGSLGQIIIDASDAFLWFDIVNHASGLSKMLSPQISVAFAALATLYAAIDTYRAQSANNTNPENTALIEQIWDVVKTTSCLMIPLLVLQDSFIPYDLPKQIIAFVGLVGIALYVLGKNIDLHQIPLTAFTPTAKTDVKKPSSSDRPTPDLAQAPSFKEIIQQEIHAKGVFNGLGNLGAYGAGKVFQNIEALRQNNPSVQKGLDIAYRTSRIVIATSAIYMPFLSLTEWRQTAFFAFTIPPLLYSVGEANPQRVGKKKLE